MYVYYSDLYASVFVEPYHFHHYRWLMSIVYDQFWVIKISTTVNELGDMEDILFHERDAYQVSTFMESIK
jgi:hypothetical protein